MSSTWESHIPNFKFVQVNILQISRLQGFQSLTSNDLDLGIEIKTIGFIYSIWGHYMPHMKIVPVHVLQISRLQGFQSLTSPDLKWNWNWNKNNRVHVLNMGKPHAKYEVCTSSRSSDIAITRFSVFDLSWPWNWNKNNRVHLLNMGKLHTKYEIRTSCRSPDNAITSQCHRHTLTHAHTHTHTYAAWPHRFLLQGIKNSRVFYSMWRCCMPSMIFVTVTVWSFTSYCVCKFSVFDFCWPQMTLEMHQI